MSPVAYSRGPCSSAPRFAAGRTIHACKPEPCAGTGRNRPRLAAALSVGFAVGISRPGATHVLRLRLRSLTLWIHRYLQASLPKGGRHELSTMQPVGSRSVVEVDRPAEPLSAFDEALAVHRRGNDEAVTQSLMVSLALVVLDKDAQAAAQVRFAKRR
jgi:hypothetical protein